MKAAFGGFIECLDVIYCSDLCADVVAESFNFFRVTYYSNAILYSNYNKSE